MKSTISRGLAGLGVAGLLAAGIVGGQGTAWAHQHDRDPIYSDACRDNANYFHVGAWYWIPGYWEGRRWHDARWIWCVP
ncbi:MAG: hypothetical protein LLG14_21740 [Nocardiaceae bacterium]|nr:hypothetical protein [Nocardiaceae bacterium]